MNTFHLGSPMTSPLVPPSGQGIFWFIMQIINNTFQYIYSHFDIDLLSGRIFDYNNIQRPCINVLAHAENTLKCESFTWEALAVCWKLLLLDSLDKTTQQISVVKQKSRQNRKSLPYYLWCLFQGNFPVNYNNTGLDEAQPPTTYYRWIWYLLLTACC